MFYIKTHICMGLITTKNIQIKNVFHETNKVYNGIFQNGYLKNLLYIIIKSNILREAIP